MQSKAKVEGIEIKEEEKIEDSIIELSEKGKEQAEKLGEKLNNYIKNNKIKKENSLILISPYKRARSTFEIVNQKLKFDENKEGVFVLNSLREQSYGAFHMISKETKKQEYGKIYNECQRIKSSYYKPQFLGESPAEVSDRLWNVCQFIKEYSEENNIENVFIFGHGNVNRCMLMNLLNLPPEFYDDFKRGSTASIINIKKGMYNEML